MLEKMIIGNIKNGVYVIDGTPDVTDEGRPLPKNIPAFDGGEYDGIYAAGDACFVVCINKASDQDFASYIAKLESSGFIKCAENTMAENLYYTYKNKESYVFIYYVRSLKTVRIIAEPYYECPLETKGNNIVKPAIIASSACDRNFYIRLPNNSLVIIDGGWRIEDRSRFTVSELLTNMYHEMCDITGNDIIKVPLWIITHGHSDHVGVAEFLHTLPLAKKFVIDRILYNFPAISHTDDGIMPTKEKIDELNADLDKWHKSAGKEIPYENIFYNCPFYVPDAYHYELICREAFKHYNALLIKAHSGMKLNICGVVFDVLHTPEDDMPAIFKNKNDLSIIIKMTYQGSSMLWLGDMCEIPSTSCVKMYGDFLKSDAMQVSHHGWGAATPEFYDRVKPTVLFWNNSEFGFKYADKYQGYGKTKTSTDLYNMDCVKKNFFCNRINMSYAYLPINIKPPQSNNAECKILASAVSDRTYMFKLPNGKLIVMDAGWRKKIWDSFNKNELISKMYYEMSELAGTKDVKVAAFISTNCYAHNNRFLEKLCDCEVKDNIKIEKIICNFPSNNKVNEKIVSKEYIGMLKSRFEVLADEVITAKSEQSFKIYGVDLEILFAPESENNYKNIADTSLVTRISFGGESIIFTGDMTDEISRKLIKKYGKNLKCDVVQIANHGYNNCGIKEFYELCSARLQLWNNSEYGYRFFKKDEGYAKTKTSTEVFGLDTCKLNVFCDQVKPQIYEFPLNDKELLYHNDAKNDN